jgi:hypothetical protein
MRADPAADADVTERDTPTMAMPPRLQKSAKRPMRHGSLLSSRRPNSMAAPGRICERLVKRYDTRRIFRAVPSVLGVVAVLAMLLAGCAPPSEPYGGPSTSGDTLTAVASVPNNTGGDAWAVGWSDGWPLQGFILHESSGHWSKIHPSFLYHGIVTLMLPRFGGHPYAWG